MSDKKPVGLLVILYTNSFVAAYCNSLVNIALVDIMNEFAISATIAQWTVSGYTIVTAIAVTSMAFVYSRFGARSIFFAAQLCFVVSDIACLWSPNFAMLMAGRLLQAVGTGLSTPLMMNAIMQLVDVRRRGFMLGVASTIITLGPAFAPIVSGVFCTLFGWRSIFAPLLVLSIVVSCAGAALMRDFNEIQDATLDAISALLMAIALFALSFGLTQIVTDLLVGMVSLGAGAVLLWAFSRRQHGKKNPYLNLEPLRHIRFWPCCLMVLAALMTTFSVNILLPLYVEQGLGYSALDAGVLMLVAVIFNTATGLIAGLLIDRFGAWPLLPIGFTLIVCGQVVIFVLAPQYLVACMIAGACGVCAGVGLTSSPSQVTGLSSLEPRLHPHGVSIITAFIQLSGCVAPSLYVGVMNAVQEGAISAGSTFEVAVACGLQGGMLVALCVSIAALVLSLVYTRIIQKRY